MPRLGPDDRASLPDSAFAYVDSRGRRRLPINDEAHVRNALARFSQVRFETDAAREKARTKLLKAAKKHGIVPVGFITGQFESERAHAALARSADLPTGFITLLMTDIEGSTALVARLGDRYDRLLRTVRSQLRRAVVGEGGRPVDVRGDEFFAVFEQADPAVAAALAIQRAMVAHRWPDDLDVRVRTAVHSGDTTLTEEGYIGLAVHIASRLCAAAHGGQVLVSGNTKSAMAGSTEAGFLSLGRFRLRGLPEATEVFQVGPPGPPAEFQPLRSAVAKPVGRRLRG